MERRIRERYDDHIFSAAKRRFGIDDDKIDLLDGFESYIYAFERDGGHFILRIGHSLRRTVNMIHGEIDWINHLAAGGAGVARAVNSATGNLVELIDDDQGGSFLATAFVRAPGRPPRESDWWNEGHFESYGRLLGRMHALSKDYEPPDPAWRRPEWDDPVNQDPDKWLPASEAIALERFRELMAYLHTLPKDQDSYGLIHQDAHAGNFHVDDDGSITFFDFDDCTYSWYVYDLAMVLFYAVTNRDDVDAFAPRFWENFMRGYNQENFLDPAWFKEIPHFLKLREIDLYSIIHRSFEEKSLASDPWAAGFMRGRKENIENGDPYLTYDLFA